MKTFLFVSLLLIFAQVANNITIDKDDGLFPIESDKFLGGEKDSSPDPLIEDDISDEEKEDDLEIEKLKIESVENMKKEFTDDTDHTAEEHEFIDDGSMIEESIGMKTGPLLIQTRAKNMMFRFA
jgi:hypothetical protein